MHGLSSEKINKNAEVFDSRDELYLTWFCT